MTQELILTTIKSLLPKGKIWNATGDYELILKSIAQALLTIFREIESIPTARDFSKSVFIDELVSELGIPINSSTTEEDKKKLIQAELLAQSGANLEEILQTAGFNVFVHANRPPVDPAKFLKAEYWMTADDVVGRAGAGFNEAIAGRKGGSLLVGNEYSITRNLYYGAGDPEVVAGNATAGEFKQVQIIDVEYKLPTDPKYYHYVYFIGGKATRDVSGQLEKIEYVNIPQAQEQIFKRLVLKYGIADSWASLLINFN